MSASVIALLVWGVASLAALGWWGYSLYRLDTKQRGEQ